MQDVSSLKCVFASSGPACELLNSRLGWALLAVWWELNEWYLRVTVAMLPKQGSLLLKFPSCEFFIFPQALCGFLLLRRLQKKCLTDIKLLFLDRLRISASED